MTSSKWRDIARNAFIYALATTILVMSTAFVLSALLGSAQRELADRVDKNTIELVHKVEENRIVLCALLRGADDPQIQRAWQVYCRPGVSGTP